MQDQIFKGDFSNQTYPEASPEVQEAEASKEKALRDTIGVQLDSDADEAEARVRNNPNIAAFGPDSLQDSVNQYRSKAMDDRAEKIVVSLFGDVVDGMNLTEEQKKTIVKTAAYNLVSQHINTKPNPVRDSLETQFN